MKRAFISVHVRAFSHATEDLEKVLMAVRNVAGDVDLESKKTEGHHGNPLIVIEGSSTGSDSAEKLLARLNDHDLREIADTAEQRIDDSCNLFLRLDKQRAYAGEPALTGSDDAVSVRIKVSAFPARAETAVLIVGEYIADLLVGRANPPPK